MDLSVCIVAWNGRDLSRACLTSLRQFTQRVSYEVIFVDNGSDDDTEAMLISEFPWVSRIRNGANRGYPAANNQALRVATGRYAILLNNDMVFESDALSAMVEFMNANPHTGVLGCRLRYPNGEVQLTAHGDTRWQDHVFQAIGLHLLMPRSPLFGHSDCTYLPFESDTLAAEVGYVAGAALMIPTSTLTTVGYLDERIRFTGEDWEWCRRYAAHGYRVVYFGGAQIVHYHGMSTIRYTGRDRDLVRWKSIMHMTATSHYVYRKLHPDARLRILLFSIAFRMHWLTRVFSHGVIRPLLGRRLERGVVRGFWDGATSSYHSLAARFLDLDAPASTPPPKARSS